LQNLVAIIPNLTSPVFLWKYSARLLTPSKFLSLCGSFKRVLETIYMWPLLKPNSNNWPSNSRWLLPKNPNARALAASRYRRICRASISVMNLTLVSAANAVVI
jgi:hypothetical protein